MNGSDCPKTLLVGAYEKRFVFGRPRAGVRAARLAALFALTTPTATPVPALGVQQECAYIANSESRTISVINTSTQTLSKTIQLPNGRGPAGIANPRRGIRLPWRC